MVVLAVLAAMWGCVLAAAHPGDSDIDRWFERQHSVANLSCCGVGDGRTLEDNQWRIRGTDYEVQIDGAWLRVARPDYLRDNQADPNPTHHAVVWTTVDTTQPGGVRIWCFTPGPLT